MMIFVLFVNINNIYLIISVIFHILLSIRLWLMQLKCNYFHENYMLLHIFFI